MNTPQASEPLNDPPPLRVWFCQADLDAAADEWLRKTVGHPCGNEAVDEFSKKLGLLVGFNRYLFLEERRRRYHEEMDANEERAPSA